MHTIKNKHDVIASSTINPSVRSVPIGLVLASLTFPNLTLAAEKDAKQDLVNKPTSVTLPVIQVKANIEMAQDSYQSTKTRVGKITQDPHDVPQAITTVTKQLMHDQQTSSLREALKNVSGLTFNAAEGGRAGDNMMLRGFYTFGDTYLDGMRDTAQYNRETFNLEQVDVLRGSAAMLFGRGQAGGVINQVSKTPTLRDENNLSASLGEYNYHQLTGDFNKKLADTTAIRINMMDRTEENYRQNPSNNDSPTIDRKGVAVSFGTGISTNNELLLSHVFTKTRDIPDYGVSFFEKRPINKSIGDYNIDDTTYYGGNKNFDDSDTNITTATFTHKSSKDTEIRTQLRHADYERAYWAKTPSASILPTANYSAGGNQTRAMEYSTLNVQTDLSTKVKLAGMQHQILTGFEYLKEDSFRNTLQPINPTTGQPYPLTGNALNAAIAINGVIYNKNFLSTSVASTKFKANNYAFYVQDTIEFIPKWELLLGVRRDELRADYSSTTSPSLRYGENSYRSGLSYHYSQDTHYYTSWSDSFSPTADLYQLSVKPQPAERSKTLEIGAKWLLLEGDLALRTALYSTNKNWERNTDLESTSAILTKRRRTNGFELELAGRINDDWEVFSGLALMNAKIIKAAENINATSGAITYADTRFEGQRARNTPTITFNAWTTYRLDTYWKIAGGVEAKGKRFGYSPSQTATQTSTATGVFSNGKFSPNTLPGYMRMDAMIAYEEVKWAVRLNIKNILNKVYYDAIYDNGGFSTPANSRTAIITTEYKF